VSDDLAAEVVLDKLINAQWKRIEQFLNDESTANRYNTLIFRDINVLVRLLALRMGEEDPMPGEGLSNKDPVPVDGLNVPPGVVKALSQIVQERGEATRKAKSEGEGGV